MRFKEFMKKLSNWLEDFFEISLGLDIDVDVAKRNCQRYKDEYERRVKREQKEYTLIVCDRIKTTSRMGGKSINTKDSLESFMTHGLPIHPRGCCKTYLYIWHFLRYIAFDVVINEYKKTDREVSLQEAHDDMNYFISEMMNEIRV